MTDPLPSDPSEIETQAEQPDIAWAQYSQIVDQLTQAEQTIATLRAADSRGAELEMLLDGVGNALENNASYLELSFALVRAVDDVRLRAEAAEHVWSELSTEVGCSSPDGSAELEQVRYREQLRCVAEAHFTAEREQRTRLEQALRGVLDSINSSLCGDPDAECSLQDAHKSWHPVSEGKALLAALSSSPPQGEEPGAG